MAAAVERTTGALRSVIVGRTSKRSRTYLEAGAQGPDPFEHRGDLALHLGQVFLDQVAAVDDDAAAVRDAGCGQAGIAVLLFPCAAVDRVDVEGRLLRAFRDHRHFRALGGEKGEKRRFHLGEDGAHVAHR